MPTTFITVPRRARILNSYFNQFITPINTLENRLGVPAAAPSAAGQFLRSAASAHASPPTWQALTGADIGAGAFSGAMAFDGNATFNADTAFKVGSALAAAATVDLTAGPVIGNVFSVTGSTTITTITARRSGDWLLLIPASGATWRLGSGGTIATPTLSHAVEESVLLYWSGSLWYRVGVPTPLRYASIATSAQIVSSTVGTTETAFDKSVTLPANALAAGSLLRISAGGRVTSGGSAVNLTLRLRLAGDAFVEITFAVPTNSAAASWQLRGIGVVRVAGASGTLYGDQGFGIMQGVSAAINQRGARAVNTTVALAMTVSAQWSANVLATNVELDTLLVEVIRPETTS